MGEDALCKPLTVTYVSLEFNNQCPHRPAAPHQPRLRGMYSTVLVKRDAAFGAAPPARPAAATPWLPAGAASRCHPYSTLGARTPAPSGAVLPPPPPEADLPVFLAPCAAPPTKTPTAATLPAAAPPWKLHLRRASRATPPSPLTPTTPPSPSAAIAPRPCRPLAPLAPPGPAHQPSSCGSASWQAPAHARCGHHGSGAPVPTWFFSSVSLASETKLSRGLPPKQGQAHSTLPCGSPHPNLPIRIHPPRRTGRPYTFVYAGCPSTRKFCNPHLAPLAA